VSHFGNGSLSHLTNGCKLLTTMPFLLEMSNLDGALYFLEFTQTDSNKFFSASRNFLGGLAAIFSLLVRGYKPQFSLRRPG